MMENQKKPDVIPFKKKTGTTESDFLFFMKDETPEDARTRLDEKLDWQMPPLGDLEVFDMGGRKAFRRLR